MGKLVKKAGRIIKKGVGLGTLGLVGDMPGPPSAADQAAADLAERTASTAVMPDDDSIKRAARRRLAKSLGRTGRASTFLSDPSEGL